MSVWHEHKETFYIAMKDDFEWRLQLAPSSTQRKGGEWTGAGERQGRSFQAEGQKPQRPAALHIQKMQPALWG